ncbi:NACHT domain-containing NTPase, partial [Haladaptatus sp. W1]|uniref:NACHT domain-containing protein n=1 Tax=Haladaptatus sp. W1 TaxID=1897478 RepID=UPI001112EF49
MPDPITITVIEKIGGALIGPIVSGVIGKGKRYVQVKRDLNKSDKKISHEYSLTPGYLKQAFDHDGKYYLDPAEATAKAADQLDSIFQKKQLDVKADSETIIEAFIKDFERRLMNYPDRATPILYEYIIRMNMRQEDFFTQFTAYYDTLREDQERVDQLTQESLQTTYTSEGLNEQFHEEQVSQILELVSSGTSVFVTGEAGAGKSSVITRAARKFTVANEDSNCVFIDAAQFTQVDDLSKITGLSNNLDRVLNYILGQSASVLLTVDSLDRLGDNRARRKWANILHRVSDMEDVTVLTACRAWDYEQHEFDSLRETFRDIKVEALSDEEVCRILDSLGISKPTPAIVDLCTNPLYLSFVAEMIRDAPNANLEDIKSEIRLWHRFRESLEKEDRLGGQVDQTMVAEATRYAQESLKSGKSTFQVKKHKPVVQRLIARDVIRKHKRERYKFRHEQIRLYFAAWELANQAFGLTDETPLENPGYKTDLQFIEVLSWLEKIYREDSVESSAELIQSLIDGSNLGLFIKSRTLALILQAGPSKLDAGTIKLVFRQLETHIWFESYVLHRLGTEWIDPLNQLGIFDTLSAEKLQFLRDHVTDDEEAILHVLRDVDFSTSDADPKSLVHLVLQLSTVQIAALT